MLIEQITLYHTNDIHSSFDHWAQIVGHVKKHRNESTLFLELGDHTDRCHSMTEATEGKGNVALLNEAGVDYATIGNNEGITFSKAQLEQLYEQARFPVIVANLFERDRTRPQWVKPYAIHAFASGLRVGLIGWTAPFTHLYEQLGWSMDSTFEPLRDLVEEVRQQVDVVILMSHLGLFRDEEIAETIEGIDVIVGSHSHHLLEKGKRVYGTLITQVGKQGKYLGEINLAFDFHRKRVVESEARIWDATQLTADRATEQLLARLDEEARVSLAEVVSHLPMTMPVLWQQETELTQLLCSALAEWCNKEIAMLNAGVLLNSLEQGPITKGDIHRTCPHPINPCIVNLTGRQLREAIIRSFTRELRTLKLKGFGFRGKILGRMIFTGIEVSLNREEQVEAIYILGEPLQEERVYELATLDMYTFGHLYPSIYEAEEKIYFMPELLRDILAWKLAQNWP